MAQALIDLDRKIARASGLPAFLQRRIQFREASADDRPSMVSYASKPKLAASPKPGCKPDQGITLYDPSRLTSQWPAVGRIGSGLQNLGNTCFLNSCLQCLCYTIPLHHYLLSEHWGTCLARASSEHCMLCELGRLFKQMVAVLTPTGTSSSAKRPSGIVSRIKTIARHFKPGRQEDAHEFLRYFVDSLQRSALFGVPSDTPPPVKETTAVNAVFGGLLRSCITCGRCGHVSTTSDFFMDLSLEIRTADTISAAIGQFCKRELLTKGNKYRCGACGVVSEATKQMQIERPPTVLTLHLKRFSYTTPCGGGKLSKPVAFSPELDISDYVVDGDKQQPRSCQYRLYALLVHDGQSTHSGHYYSFVCSSNGLWYCMNDDSVTQVGLNTVLKQRAYILFYQRVPPDGPPRSPLPSAATTAITAAQEETVINVEECSDSGSIARSNSMWHMMACSPTVPGIASPACTARDNNCGSVRNGKACKPRRRNIRWNISSVLK